MHGTAFDVPTEWFEFDDPSDSEQAWKVHVGFMLSSWQCLFGNGCEGIHSKDEPADGSVGCCRHGAYLNSKKELAALQKRVDQMTEEDLGPKALAYVRKNGWKNTFRESHPDHDDDYLNAKTKVRDGACVFANRPDDGDGKIGCAFVHQGARLQKKAIADIDHTAVMPNVCWQLPIGVRHTTDHESGLVMTTLMPWDAAYWNGPTDDDGNTDSFMAWWCVDSPQAYIAEKAVYRTMEKELRRIMGNASYDLLAQYLDTRIQSTHIEMPAQTERKMLPLTVVR